MKHSPLLVTTLITAVLLFGMSFAEDTPDTTDDTETTPDTLLTSYRLDAAAAELSNLEAQIALVEARLIDIEAELVLLRRESAMVSSAGSAFLLAEELYTSGSIVWAKEAFESVVENFDDSPYYSEAIFRLELILFELQDYEAANDYFNLLRSVDPAFEHIDLALITAGLAQFNLKDYDSSLEYYEQVAPSGEYGALATYLTAVVYIENDNIDQAQTTFENILNRSGNLSGSVELADRTRIALAQLKVDEGKLDEAIDYYSQVSPFSGYYDVAMLGKIWAYMRQEEYQKAYDLAARVMQEVPASELKEEFELAMANCALGAEDLDIAVSMYQNLLSRHIQVEENQDIFLSEHNVAAEEYEQERERLDRIRLGLAELKEEAYEQGDEELVALITAEELALRELFVEISNLEVMLSLPMNMSTETMIQTLESLIRENQDETQMLALAIGDVRDLAEIHGTEQDRANLIELEEEVERIRLALQDLSTKFESSMAVGHDWVEETEYGIAIATFMERELKRDSVTYLSLYYSEKIQEAYDSGDSSSANSLEEMRNEQISKLNERIDEDAVVSAGYFEEYDANYPDSRFIPDVLVRLAQLYYDIDGRIHDDLLANAEEGEYIPDDYSRSIELYEKIISEYPGSELEDVALYSLGYCLENMMDFEAGVDRYQELLLKHSTSVLAAECNIRVGNYHFDNLRYDSAFVYYNRILEFPAASPNLYQHGLYKLGWTKYLQKDYVGSIAVFAYLLQDDRTIQELNIERQGDMRIINEARQYMAYNFLEMGDSVSVLPPVPSALTFLTEFNDIETTISVLKQMAEISTGAEDWQTVIEAYQALLTADPTSPNAPYYQADIALAYEQNEQFANAADARDVLVAVYGENGEWFAVIDADSALAFSADSLRVNSLESAIQYYLELCVNTKEQPAAYQTSNEELIDRILLYLAEYPSSQKVYDFKVYLGDAYYHLTDYENAGDVYYSVAMDSSSFQNQESSFNNAFLSYFAAYEGVGVDTLDILGKMKETVMDFERAFPQGENIAEDYWLTAIPFFNAGHYSDVRELLEPLYEDQYSGYAARSAKYIGDTYSIDSLYADAELWYDRAEQMAFITGEDLEADIGYLAASSAYSDAISLAESETSEDLIAAAERWEQTAMSYPNTEVAPVSLDDAADAFDRAGDIANAVRVYEKLADLYPQYINCPQGLLRAAFLLREDEQFTRAAQMYVRVYNEYPGYEGVVNALSTAALSYEDADDMYNAISIYSRIATERVGGAATVIEAYAKIGLYEYERGNITVASGDFSNVLSLYDEYRDGVTTYPAMAAFYLAEAMGDSYYALPPANTENVGYRTQLFNDAIASYNRTFNYLEDDYLFRAVLKIGELQMDYANTVGFMEAPAGLTPEDEDVFYNTLLAVYDDYFARAISSYETGLGIAVENDIRTVWTDSIAANLDNVAFGASINLGYTEPAEPEPVIEVSDTTSVSSDSTDLVLNDSIYTGDIQEIDIAVPDESATEDDGGCFLWPF